MELYIAGGCEEHGRNSFLLKGEKDYLLIDCGILKGKENKYPKINKDQINKIKYLFLTHSHKDHIGALDWLIENGFNGVMVSTEDTKEQANIYYKKWMCLEVNNEMPKEVEIESNLKVIYGRNGHCLGSLWYLILWENKKIFFSGDYSEDSEVYICDKAENIMSDIAILDCGKGNNIISIDSFLSDIRNYTSNLKEENKVILFPVPKYGRGQEIINLLKNLTIPIYLDEHLYNQISRKSYWVKEEYLTERFDYNLLSDWDSWSYAILFVSDPQLKKTENQKIAMKIANDNSYIIFTGHIYNDTFSEKIYIDRLGNQVSYPTHMNYKKIYNLIKRNAFNKVILNHSKEKIQDSFNVVLDRKTGDIIDF